MQYRCPVDDVVFKTSKVDREPTLQGHPECPGPECQEKLADGFFDAFLKQQQVTVAPAAPVQAAPAAPGASGKPVSPLPVGQGW
jgi:hypothetical protein